MAELDRQILKPMVRNSAIAFWVMTTTAFLLVTLYYIIFHHVEPLSRDQWQMYQALFDRGLVDTSLGTVSGHRHILAFMLYHIDMALFDGRNRFLVGIDWLLNGALIFLLCSQAWKLPLSKLARTLFCGWIIILLTWLLNIALLGWGFNGLNNYLSLVPGVFALFFLHHAVRQNRSVLAVVAGLLGILATLSFANGILVWPTALIVLYLLHASRVFYIWMLVAMTAAIAAYVLLPGADAAGEALKWPGSAFVIFPFQVMGGPIYHLLRSWQAGDPQWLRVVSNGAGFLITVTALCRFGKLLYQRPMPNAFQTLCVALMCFGAGSCIMLSMSRLDEFLDPAVDRFQIFALLVWIGTSGLIVSTANPATVRRWEAVFIIFPFLAFPSQLDWGARLAEYRNRVDMSLLAYQVYLPLEKDTEKALHWNWENKLPAFFTVLEQIRHDKKNIFHTGTADFIGKPFRAAMNLPVCNVTEMDSTTITASELLKPEERVSIANLPQAQLYRIESSSNSQRVGQRWHFTVHDAQWDSGLLLDTQQTARGLVYPVNNSRLPRANGHRKADFNAYGVVKLDDQNQIARTLVLLDGNNQVCQHDL